MFVDDHPGASLDEILAHHGVKGMHWGVRRGSSSGGGGGKGRSQPHLLPGARTSMAVGRGVGQKIHDYNHKPDASGTSRKQARAAIRDSNRKATRQLEDFNNSPRAKRDAQILKARENLLRNQRLYEDSRRQIKANRSTIGKNAARIALNEAANKHAHELDKANTLTGREHTMKVLQAVGNHLLNTASANAAARASAARPRPAPQQPYRTTSTRVG